MCVDDRDENGAVRPTDERCDAWLTEVFRTCADRVFAYLLHRTDRETAQDLLQEVFVTAHRKAGDVPEPPIGWLLGTARRLLANHYRSTRRHNDVVLRLAAHPAPDTGDSTATTAVGQALAELSEKDREVLTLSAWYGLTGEEAAAVLDCSVSAYNVRLHRARHRLAERLRTNGFPTLRTAELTHD